MSALDRRNFSGRRPSVLIGLLVVLASLATLTWRHAAARSLGMEGLQSEEDSPPFTVVNWRFPETQANEDLDHDGLPDSLEQELAERYAPIIFHDPDEPNLPTNVEIFLPQTELWFYDERCPKTKIQISKDLRGMIPRRRQPPCSPSEADFDSHGTRSHDKQRSFFVKSVEGAARKGSSDTRNWTTYYHSYRNGDGGITIQYWRFYSYNTGEILGLRTKFGSHGGDWEAIHVVLDAGFKPTLARFLGHRDISERQWTSLLTEGDHLLVKSEKGGHTSRPLAGSEQKRAKDYIRQETWTGGKVRWLPKHQLESDTLISPGGRLLNLGEKTAPMERMEFIQYSGLWGSRESGGLLSALRSGYWGPAFNETGMGKDNFITAWCQGMPQTLRNRVAANYAEGVRECYPTEVSR